ncbi:GRAS transcription factor [Heracleum sosnowskyi]|uniref:GRAS transcription factor n=1 Tax=Heracleum sosnowskyi TaxID=360622 RepID=A0AAD8GNA0_9APIA|nr:GRAS transcription factor [Heracleum sosnowskyi]
MSNIPSKQLNSCKLVELNSSSEHFESESEERGKRKEHNDFNRAGDRSVSMDVNPFRSDNAIGKEILSHIHEERQMKSLSPFGSLEDLYYDAISPPFQSCQEDITKVVTVKSEDSELGEPQKLKSEKLNLESLSLLKNYGYRFRHLKGQKIEVGGCSLKQTKDNGHKLSIDAIIRLAGESFIRSSILKCNDPLEDSYVFSNKLLGISAEDSKDIKLVEILLASAEKVGQKKFRRARKLLSRCCECSSEKGNPCERLVHYFCAALSEKIDHHIGRETSKTFQKKLQLFDFEDAVMSQKSANLAFHKEVPFSQVSQFAGVQAIIEHVAEANKVHIIDFVIMNGSNCIVLMQALVTRDGKPIEHLRITAIGTKSKERIEETGKRLMNFAESVKLPFSFNAVMVADMLDLNENILNLNAEEVVVVQSSYLFSTMIAKSDRLEYVMRVIRNINPSIMVMIENEGNYNSSVFVKRFVEALFYYGAFFDCMEDCMERSNQNRLLVELIHFSPAIQNIVVAEGKERTLRQVDMSVWRSFFKRFAMVELELSKSSLYQASLIVNKFACGSSCTLDRDGKCLIIGWKGTPIHSLSAWKFV